MAMEISTLLWETRALRLKRPGKNPHHPNTQRVIPILHRRSEGSRKHNYCTDKSEHLSECQIELDREVILTMWPFACTRAAKVPGLIGNLTDSFLQDKNLSRNERESRRWFYELRRRIWTTLSMFFFFFAPHSDVNPPLANLSWTPGTSWTTVPSSSLQARSGHM